MIFYVFPNSSQDFRSENFKILRSNTIARVTLATDKPSVTGHFSPLFLKSWSSLSYKTLTVFDLTFLRQHYTDLDRDVVDTDRGQQDSVRPASDHPGHPCHPGRGHPDHQSNPHPDQLPGETPGRVNNSNYAGDEDLLPPNALASITRATTTLRQLGPLPHRGNGLPARLCGPNMADAVDPQGPKGAQRPPVDPLRERRAKYSTFDRRKGNGCERRGGVAGGIR